MAEDEVQLPDELALLWGRRSSGRRGPRPELDASAIVAAAVEIADADGLEAVSMARVAKQLGFSTMALYRHVANKEELLSLMWNESASVAQVVEITGDTWRERMRSWASLQRDMLTAHPWLAQMPISNPPMGPSAFTWIERGLDALTDTPLSDVDKLQAIGAISAYTLAEARMAYEEATAAARRRAEGKPVVAFENVIGLLADPAVYPHLARLAAITPTMPAAGEPGYEEMVGASYDFGLELLLDGMAAAIARAGGEATP
ncbi:TetR/AcrR family transcriptional regulator [Mumia sp. ZJ1417]|uniref:TetR/AcrR family transcriptional regulator n=1 Tax=unclassified Mumia TaxID=2621872 RepID=UPI001420B99A|nr:MULTISPECIES: TetR/AcrR family transcriptional regulator [unclassified Mumia]QMW66665.1 TetR/AcrR family transcriptional regulator [Mumia sp. ZJ1417]